MTPIPWIHSDFMSSDELGRVFVDSMGLATEIGALGVVLQPGMTVLVYDLDGDEHGTTCWLTFFGTLHCDERSGKWVAQLEPQSRQLRPISDAPNVVRIAWKQ
jgi:hypothetical protein